MRVKKPKDLNRIVNKHQRRSKGQSKMDNPEKLASLDTETKNEDKHKATCVGHHYDEPSTKTQ